MSELYHNLTLHVLQDIALFEKRLFSSLCANAMTGVRSDFNTLFRKEVWKKCYTTFNSFFQKTRVQAEMEYSKWFDYQLRSTLDGFIWAVQQLPRERWYALPPSPLGEWSAAQHVFHMLTYEQRLALPTMHQWLGAPPVAREADSKQVEQELPSMEELLSQFKQVRESEIEMLSKFEDVHWNSIRSTTFWGDVNLYWLVCKIYQHTNEHTHDVLRLGLFWDRILARMAQS